jgi:unsaturated rhamnogalacturonyl hydrolase
MKRREFLCNAALVGLPLATVRATPASKVLSPGGADPSGGMQIAKATMAAMTLQRRDWEQGILAQAFLEAGDRERVLLLTKSAIVQRTSDGRLGVLGQGGPTDPAMGGAAYAAAARWTTDPAIAQAVEDMLVWIRDRAPRSADGILYHTFRAPEMWSDGFNCAPPFLAALGEYDAALKQIEGYRACLWNQQARLMSHVWNEGDKRLSRSTFWGGGNGWAAAGMARVICSLPRERAADRLRVAGYTRELIDGCLAHQCSDGLFHNVVDRPDTFVETNLAQMLAYAIYTGVRDGWLPAPYRAHADKMREAARNKMDAYGFVQGACGAPAFDAPGVSTEAQAFTILMEAAANPQA